MKKRVAQDLNEIHIHNLYNRRTWAKRFGCNTVRLEEAVMAVGTDPKKVGAWLIKQIEAAIA